MSILFYKFFYIFCYCIYQSILLQLFPFLYNNYLLIFLIFYNFQIISILYSCIPARQSIRYVLLREMPPHSPKSKHMCGYGNQPGHRIRQIQHFQCAEYLKYGHHPQNSKAAGSGQRNQHGNHRISQPPQAPHHAVHHSANKIRAAYNAQPAGSIGQNLWLRGIDSQKNILSQNCQKPQSEADRHDHPQAAEHNFIDAPVFLATQILTGKA